MTLHSRSNFLTLYHHAAGTSIVPDAFHTWSALSLIAAAVADRVGYWKTAEGRLAPNLYVWLVGPSGGGKGTAIKRALRMAEMTPQVNVYSGSVTRAGLFDWLGAAAKEGTLAKTWLVSRELAFAIVNPVVANDLLCFMTEIYEGSTEPLRGNTRTHGARHIEAPCVNWLAGSTIDWVKMSVPTHILAGGFIARMVFVIHEEDPPRILEPAYPSNRAVVEEWLKQRVMLLAEVSGDMQLTEKAKAVRLAWYRDQPMPEDRREREWFQREDDLVLKVAMLCALADNPDRVVKSQHMVQAQRLVMGLRAHVGSFLDAVSATPESADAKLVEGFLAASGRVIRSVLMRFALKRGMDAKRLDAALGVLMAAKLVRVEPTGKGEPKVVWVPKAHVMPGETMNGDGGDDDDV